MGNKDSWEVVLSCWILQEGFTFLTDIFAKIWWNFVRPLKIKDKVFAVSAVSSQYLDCI